MKRVVLGLSTVCALMANTNTLNHIEFKTLPVNISAGVMRFKNLKKTSALADIKFTVNENSRFKNIYNVNIVNIKLSSQYQDISLDSFIPYSYANYTSLYRTIFAVGGSIGYLRHDSSVHKKNLINSYDDNGDEDQYVSTSVIEIQKSPYIAIKGFAGITINSTVMLRVTAAYKYSLDRADFKNGYEMGTGLTFKNGFTLGVKYQTLYFNGADTQKDISYEIGYLFRF